MRAKRAAAVKVAIAKMIAAAITTISPTVIQQTLRRFPPTAARKNVRLSLIAEPYAIVYARAWQRFGDRDASTDDALNGISATASPSWHSMLTPW